MKNQQDHIQKMMSKAGKHLAQMAANSAFEFWQRKDFRMYVEFQNLNQVEQDRIFNELEVSVLGLFILEVDNAIDTGEKEHKVVLSLLQKEVVVGFLTLFSDAGVEEKYIKQWEILIDMRFKEYRDNLKTALFESKKWKEFKNDEQVRMQWAVIETITINCLRYIRRGDVKEDDPLWELLRKWFITLYAPIRQIVELSKGEKEKKS